MLLHSGMAHSILVGIGVGDRGCGRKLLLEVLNIEPETKILFTVVCPEELSEQGPQSRLIQDLLEFGRVTRVVLVRSCLLAMRRVCKFGSEMLFGTSTSDLSHWRASNRVDVVCRVRRSRWGGFGDG